MRRRVRHTVLGFKLEQTEESLTAHGGSALLAEFNQGLGLCALEDLRELRREAGLMRFLDRAALPDPDTLGDWLQRMGDPQTEQAGLVGLGQGREVLTARRLRRERHETDTRDVEATLWKARSGTRTGAIRASRATGPSWGFLFETPVCLVDEFREGHVSPGAWHLEFYQQCRVRMPLGKRLARYRADSASYQTALLNEGEPEQVRGSQYGGSGWGGQGRDRWPPANGLAGTGDGVWGSGRGGRAHEAGDDAGVSAQHQARSTAPARSV